MKSIQLLIVSHDAANREALKGALDQDRFVITTADSDESAVEGFCQRTFDVIVAGKALSDEIVRKLKAIVNKVANQAVLIQQKDDNYEALKVEINDAFSAKQREKLQHISVSDTTDSKNMEGLIRLIN